MSSRSSSSSARSLPFPVLLPGYSPLLEKPFSSFQLFANRHALPSFCYLQSIPRSPRSLSTTGSSRTLLLLDSSLSRRPPSSFLGFVPLPFCSSHSFTLSYVDLRSLPFRSFSQYNCGVRGITHPNVVVGFVSFHPPLPSLRFKIVC